MYSYEIQQLLELKNYLLTGKEYGEAFNPHISTQIKEIKYNPYNDTFECWTYDDYYFIFKVEPYKDYTLSR